MGLSGQYGFYESADFTPGRAPLSAEGTKEKQPSFLLVREYMAHHLGMSLGAADNALFPGRMHRRFLQDPRMGCARELLQERAGDAAWGSSIKEERPEQPQTVAEELPLEEHYSQISLASPHCAILSNGGISGFYTDSGCSWLSGYGADLTRRCEDPLRRPIGVFALFGQEGKEGSA